MPKVTIFGGKSGSRDSVIYDYGAPGQPSAPHFRDHVPRHSACSGDCSEPLVAHRVVRCYAPIWSLLEEQRTSMSAGRSRAPAQMTITNVARFLWRAYANSPPSHAAHTVPRISSIY